MARPIFSNKKLWPPEKGEENWAYPHMMAAFHKPFFGWNLNSQFCEVNLSGKS